MSDDRTPATGASWLDRLVNAISPAPENRDQLSAILQKSHDSKLIDADAFGIMEGALRLGETQAREIMIPRSQMEIIRAGADIQDVLQQIVESGHSRFPVVGESADDVIGILLAKDLLTLALNESLNPDLTSMVRPATIIPESKRLSVLLREFREDRYHMALVVDEYGSVAGLVTIEDILEEIVGDIEDETDEDELPLMRKASDGSWVVDAQTEVEDFNETFASGLSEDEFDTVGGIITNAFGHVPAPGESVLVDHLRFEVLESDERKIHLLKVSKSDH